MNRKEIYEIEQLKQDIIYFLDGHTLAELLGLIELAIDKKSSGETKQTSNPFPIITSNSKIDTMEKQCKVLHYLISKKDLNHRERMILLFTYCKFGKNGVERLKQILSQQTNYKKHITETQINAYLKKKKFYGISCKKIQEWINKDYCKGCKYA